jgi:hypothetical protein
MSEGDMSLLFCYGSAPEFAVSGVGFALGVAAGFSTASAKACGGLVGDVGPVDTCGVSLVCPLGAIVLVHLRRAVWIVCQAFAKILKDAACLYVDNFKLYSHDFFLVDIGHMGVEQVNRFFAVSVAFGLEHFNSLSTGGFFLGFGRLCDIPAVSVKDCSNNCVSVRPLASAT